MLLAQASSITHYRGAVAEQQGACYHPCTAEFPDKAARYAGLDDQLDRDRSAAGRRTTDRSARDGRLLRVDETGGRAVSGYLADRSAGAVATHLHSGPGRRG